MSALIAESVARIARLRAKVKLGDVTPADLEEALDALLSSERVLAVEVAQRGGDLEAVRWIVSAHAEIYTELRGRIRELQGSGAYASAVRDVAAWLRTLPSGVTITSTDFTGKETARDVLVNRDVVCARLDNGSWRDDADEGS